MVTKGADQDLARKPVSFAVVWGVTVLVGFEVIDLGEDGLAYVVWGTFALVLLTFVPEIILGKYVR